MNEQYRDFLISIGRNPDENLSYKINNKVFSSVMKIIECFSLNSEYDFYGFSVIPSGTDVIIKLNVDNFDTCFGTDSFDNIAGEISEISFKPEENHMVVLVKVANFFEVSDDF